MDQEMPRKRVPEQGKNAVIPPLSVYLLASRCLSGFFCLLGGGTGVWFDCLVLEKEITGGDTACSCGFSIQKRGSLIYKPK